MEHANPNIIDDLAKENAEVKELLTKILNSEADKLRTFYRYNYLWSAGFEPEKILDLWEKNDRNQKKFLGYLDESLEEKENQIKTRLQEIENQLIDGDDEARNLIENLKTFYETYNQLLKENDSQFKIFVMKLIKLKLMGEYLVYFYENESECHRKIDKFVERVEKLYFNEFYYENQRILRQLKEEEKEKAKTNDKSRTKSEKNGKKSGDIQNGDDDDNNEYGEYNEFLLKEFDEKFKGINEALDRIKTIEIRSSFEEGEEDQKKRHELEEKINNVVMHAIFYLTTQRIENNELLFYNNLIRLNIKGDALVHLYHLYTEDDKRVDVEDEKPSSSTRKNKKHGGGTKNKKSVSDKKKNKKKERFQRTLPTKDLIRFVKRVDALYHERMKNRIYLDASNAIAVGVVCDEKEDTQSIARREKTLVEISNLLDTVVFKHEMHKKHKKEKVQLLSSLFLCIASGNVHFLCFVLHMACNMLHRVYRREESLRNYYTLCNDHYGSIYNKFYVYSDGQETLTNQGTESIFTRAFIPDMEASGFFDSDDKKHPFEKPSPSSSSSPKKPSPSPPKDNAFQKMLTKVDSLVKSNPTEFSLENLKAAAILYCFSAETLQLGTLIPYANAIRKNFEPLKNA